MSQQLIVALDGARVYLGDVSKNKFTDANLIPVAQQAHRELQARLWNVGSPAVRAQSATVLISTGATNMGANQPLDIITPFRIIEFASGDVASNGVDMTEVTYMPQEPQTAILNYWMWMDEIISFLGATADRNVVVYYRRSIPIPNAVTDYIGLIFGELYLAPRIAAILSVKSSKDDLTYKNLTTISEDNFQLVVQAQRGQQVPQTRP